MGMRLAKERGPSDGKRGHDKGHTRLMYAQSSGSRATKRTGEDARDEARGADFTPYDDDAVDHKLDTTTSEAPAPVASRSAALRMESTKPS